MQKYHQLFFALLSASSLFSFNAIADDTQVQGLKQKIQTRGRTLVTHVEPVYPHEALAEKVTGSVTMSFTINLDGSISNIVVLESKPTGVFENASISALRQWQYEPVAETVKEVKTRFDFAP